MNNELIRMYKKRGITSKYVGKLVELCKPNGKKYIVLRTENPPYYTIPINRLRTWDKLSAEKKREYINSTYELLVCDTIFRIYKYNRYNRANIKNEIEEAKISLNKEREYWLSHLDEEAYLDI